MQAQWMLFSLFFLCKIDTKLWSFYGFFYQIKNALKLEKYGDSKRDKGIELRVNKTKWR